MAGSVSCQLSSKISTTETVDPTTNPLVSTVNTNSVLYTGMDENFTIPLASPSIPATKTAYFSQAMSAGAATIDLTALVGLNGAAITLSTLKIQMVKFWNPSTNGNSITVTVGASNGYLLLGSGWKIILAPGQSALFQLYNAAPAVDGTHKTIDISGTGAQALNVGIVAG